MSETKSERSSSSLNPLALRLEDLARILSVLGQYPVTVEMLQSDIDAGAPTNPDGTVNLVHYAAWLLRELGRGDRS
jgi:hypothetical protein